MEIPMNNFRKLLFISVSLLATPAALAQSGDCVLLSYQNMDKPNCKSLETEGSLFIFTGREKGLYEPTDLQTERFGLPLTNKPEVAELPKTAANPVTVGTSVSTSVPAGVPNPVTVGTSISTSVPAGAQSETSISEDTLILELRREDAKTTYFSVSYAQSADGNFTVTQGYFKEGQSSSDRFVGSAIERAAADNNPDPDNEDDNDNEDDMQTIKKGGEATFKITVTNIGNAPLKDVIIYDDLAPSCARSSAQTKGLYEGELFDPRESFSCRSVAGSIFIR